MEGGIVYLLTLVVDFFACFLYRGGSCAGLLQASLLTKEDKVQLQKSCWMGRPVFHKGYSTREPGDYAPFSIY